MTEETRVPTPTPYHSAPCGELTTATCHSCGATCTIERSVYGPTGFAEAMAGRAHLHDRIRCPHDGSAWHHRAAHLRRELHDTSSRRLRAMLQQELDEMLGR